MFVGKTLTEALEILKEQNNENYKIIRYNNDRKIKSDNELVIRERYVDGILELVVTDVLLEIWFWRTFDPP